MTALTLEAKLLERLEQQALEIARLQAKLVMYDEQQEEMVPQNERQWEVVRVDLEPGTVINLYEQHVVREQLAKALAKELVPYMINRHNSTKPLAITAEVIVMRVLR